MIVLPVLIQTSWSSSCNRSRVIASSAPIGFIEQQHRRIDGQGSTQRHPLAHTARELVDPGLTKRVEVDHAQQMPGYSLPIAAGNPFMRNPNSILSCTVIQGKSAAS